MLNEVKMRGLGVALAAITRTENAADLREEVCTSRPSPLACAFVFVRAKTRAQAGFSFSSDSVPSSYMQFNPLPPLSELIQLMYGVPFRQKERGCQCPAKYLQKTIYSVLPTTPNQPPFFGAANSVAHRSRKF